MTNNFMKTIPFPQMRELRHRKVTQCQIAADPLKPKL